MLTDTGRHVGWIAVIGLALAGVGWVESLRSSQRAIWGLDQQPGHWLIRWLVDMAVLIGLGILLIVSVAISAGAQNLLFRLAGATGPSPLKVALNESTTLLAGVVDLVLAAALLAGVPRLRLPLRRLVPSALVIAAGLLLLKTAGRWYVARTQHNPAYQVVAGAVGLLLFMYLFNQCVLFAAALAATSRSGTVVDLAAGPPAPPPPEPAAVPAGSEEAEAARDAGSPAEAGGGR
jgi:membrane protein